MKRAVIFDTAIGTGNQGDDIIYDSILDSVHCFLKEYYVMRFGTHILNFSAIQMRKNGKTHYCRQADLKLICGTNLLSHSYKVRVPQWQINPFNVSMYRDSILVGVGSTRSINKIDNYTKRLYLKALSKDYYHSVRDEQTKARLESIGLKALNTGCPTLWCMTKEKCMKIKKEKSKKAIITVSGHHHLCDSKQDEKMIEIINKNYDEVYAWIQTVADEDYLDSIQGTQQYKKIFSLKEYSKVLDEEEVDYIGTRLHGGIHAMQHDRRAIIIIIDHRARGIFETSKINALERDEIEKLDDMINSKITTDIILPEKEIEQWFQQFLK